MVHLSDAQMRHLRQAVQRWSDAAYRGDSNDREHERAHDLASIVANVIGTEIDYSSGEDE